MTLEQHYHLRASIQINLLILILLLDPGLWYLPSCPRERPNLQMELVRTIIYHSCRISVSAYFQPQKNGVEKFPVHLVLRAESYGIFGV